jgi:hypothetical protein
MQELTERDADIFLTNLKNTLILFAKNAAELKALEKPTFEPIYEMQDGLDYSLSDLCIDTIFKYQLLDNAIKEELMNFKQGALSIESNKWQWSAIDTDPIWTALRQIANTLLEKINVTNKDYIDDYSISFDSDGNVVEKGKKM